MSTPKLRSEVVRHRSDIDDSFHLAGLCGPASGSVREPLPLIVELMPGSILPALFAGVPSNP
jgi:hypothetical protein